MVNNKPLLIGLLSFIVSYVICIIFAIFYVMYKNKDNYNDNEGLNKTSTNKAINFYLFGSGTIYTLNEEQIPTGRLYNYEKNVRGMSPGVIHLIMNWLSAGVGILVGVMVAR